MSPFQGEDTGSIPVSRFWITVVAMKNAILVHGTCDEDEYFDEQYPSMSNSHWFPWLQKQLLVRRIHTSTPEMPDAYAPDYVKWKKEFERYDITESTILVGHSCGGGFLVRWLSENPVSVKQVVLVAPWLDPFRLKTTDFFEFTIDKELLSRADKLVVYVSDDDDKDILKSVEIIQSQLGRIMTKHFTGMGHFTEEGMGKSDFPELLHEIVGKVGKN